MSVSGSSPSTRAGRSVPSGSVTTTLVGVGDHVLVGDDDAVGPDDEAGAVALHHARALGDEEEIPGRPRRLPRACEVTLIETTAPDARSTAATSAVRRDVFACASAAVREATWAAAVLTDVRETTGRARAGPPPIHRSGTRPPRAAPGRRRAYASLTIASREDGSCVRRAGLGRGLRAEHVIGRVGGRSRNRVPAAAPAGWCAGCRPARAACRCRRAAAGPARCPPWCRRASAPCGAGIGRPRRGSSRRGPSGARSTRRRASRQR